MVIGTQRPDAKMFEGGARDNLRHRISLSRLSGQGAKMLWDNYWTGTDTPLVSGRAIASPDGSNPIEVQTFWVDDPWEAKAGSEDRRILDEIADLASEKFVGYDWPISREDFELFSHDETAGETTETADDETEEPLRAPAVSEEEADEDGDEEEAKFATTGEVTEHAEGGEDFETEGVMAESLCVGDQVLLDSGNLATVTEIEDTDDERVLLTLDEYGDVSSLDIEASDRMERRVDYGEDEE